jgi:hypothetical protein
VPGDAINSQRPIAVDANTLILLPLSGDIADMAGPADGFASVENDPNRLGQQYRRSKVRPVCKRRAVGLGASTNGTNTFVLMDAPC